MTTEEKDLLLRDLSARLTYGVIMNTPNGDGHLCSINQTIFGTEYGINIKATERDFFNDRECEVKPYLRPMSSMTEEEEKEFKNQIYKAKPYSDGKSYNVYEVTGLNIDWLNKNMFDYRGLIPKGLAIEVTEENNPYKVMYDGNPINNQEKKED